MKNRLIIVVAALVLGGIAAFSAWGYLGALETAASAGSQPVKVYVAKQDIARGATASDLIAKGLVEQVEMPKRYVPDGAGMSAESIANRVLAGPVSKGEILTAGRFQYASEAGLAFSVPEGLVALTVPVDDARGVAGLISPGDHVAVLATVQKKSATDQETRIVVPGVQVLAVGQNTDAQGSSTQQSSQGGSVLASSQGSGAQGSATTIVTLAVTPVESEKIVFAIESGSIWLVLLPGTSSDVKPGPGQTATSVFR
jgi:pilus assembly protein CpaB